MKTLSWLWPDRIIRKRESRRLREEHNALVNLNAELLAALKSVVPDLQWGTTARWKGEGSASLVALIAKSDPNDAFDRCPHCAAQYLKTEDVSTAAHFTGCPLKRRAS